MRVAPGEDFELCEEIDWVAVAIRGSYKYMGGQEGMSKTLRPI